MNKYDQEISQESKHWGKVLTKKGYFSWLHSPLILRVINRRITGSSQINWFTWFKNKYLQQKEVSKALVLGSGFTQWEKMLVKEKICNSVDAVDISEECIRLSREIARREKLDINYILADVNRIELTENTYDLVLCVMSLHHFKELESIFFQINKSLKADGYLLANEFIGPTLFQWEDEQLKLVNKILSIMPEKYKTRTNDGIVQNIIYKPDLNEFMKHSPFEAVRASEIINLVEKHFKLIEIRPYGGTILHLLLNFLIGNFDENKAEDQFMLELIAFFEEREIEQRNIKSDFAVLVAGKKMGNQLLHSEEEKYFRKSENQKSAEHIEATSMKDQSNETIISSINHLICKVEKLEEAVRNIDFFLMKIRRITKNIPFVTLMRKYLDK